MLVPKKDGGVRSGVDYRDLNKVTVSDPASPQQCIDDLLQDTGKAKFMTTVDLKAGYWKLPIRKRNLQKTAFATPFGMYQLRDGIRSQERCSLISAPGRSNTCESPWKTHHRVLG